MRKLLTTVAVAALFGGIAVVQAQVEVTLDPEVRTQVREQVIVRAEPVTVPSDFAVAVGTTVPETIELHEIEGVPAVVQYRYFVVDDRVVLVDPATRVIVSVLDDIDGEGSDTTGTETGAGATGQTGTGTGTDTGGAEENGNGSDEGTGGADGGGADGGDTDGDAGGEGGEGGAN